MNASPPSPESLAALLGQSAFLRGLDPPGLIALAKGVAWRNHSAGSVVFLEGEPAPSLHYIHQGWIKIVKTGPDGREQILQFSGPGELMGGIGIFVDRPAPATAIALEDAYLGVLSRDAARGIFQANPHMALPVIEHLAGRIFDLIDMVAEMSLHTVMSRLARLLLERADQGMIRRRRWATQTEIAARLGAVPDVLNRALRVLVEEGLIELTRDHIRILDAQGLAAKTNPAR